MRSASRQELLRALPAVHTLLAHPGGRALVERYGHALTAWALGQAQADARQAILRAPTGELDRFEPTPEALLAQAQQRLSDLTRRRLRRVINATGVVVHTNLGRSSLAPSAVAAVCEIATHYSTLEYDLEAGGRGSRHAHLERLLPYLTGAEAGIAVNNNAAAVLLMLAAVAAGKEVIVSRGELVEIGGSFRVPEVMAQSGVRLVEVGTTNKTRLDDYRRAIGPNTAALLKVHTSNYRIIGFTEETDLESLVKLGREHDLPVLYDLGSGVLIDLAARGIPGEPSVPAAVKAGADLVTFSGDKLLGGPQAGLIVGRRNLVEACARHPLARALRIDKMTAAALESTLLLYLDEDRALREIPTLRMLLEPLAAVEARAKELMCRLRAVLPADVGLAVVSERSQPGGGSLPGVELPTAAVALDVRPRSPAAVERALRSADPPVIARISDDKLLLDLRTVAPDELDLLVAAVGRALASDPLAPGMLRGTTS